MIQKRLFLSSLLFCAAMSVLAQSNLYIAKGKTYHDYLVKDLKEITFQRNGSVDSMFVHVGNDWHSYARKSVDSITIQRPDIEAGQQAKAMLYASEPFATGFGSFTPVTVEGQPWIIDFKTAKGTGYVSGSTKRSRSYLISPAYDLTNAREVTLSFQYVLAYTIDGPGNCVLITDNYTGDPTTTNWTDITGTLLKAGTTSSGGIDWYTFTPYEAAIPSRFLGESHVTIALFFGCDTKSTTWEVKNLQLILDKERDGQGNDDPVDTKNTNKNTDLKNAPEAWRLEFPHMKGDGRNIVISHSTADYGLTFSLEWDCDKRANRWSCYELHRGNSEKNTSRTNTFMEDPNIPTVYQTHNADYSGTGFSRGHLCPSGDRLCSEEQNKQTFYLSNIMPQYSQHNEGLWANLESLVRNKWNQDYYRDTLYIVKAATIDKADQILTNTSTGLVVPKYFYMAVLAVKNGKYIAIGLWTEHKNVTDNNKNYANYAISIRELEQRTGIDFFCNLPDDIEEQVETTLKLSSWGL